jgi:putative ABC transport system ATP-binding protein
MIKLENISKIYDIKVDNKKALDNVSLTIDNGEFVAIIGPSGSGKSTLLNILGCMDTATEGNYIVDDIKVSELNKSDMHDFRKKNIGFVFQHFALMDYYTAYENIELPLLANNIKRSQRKKLVNQQLIQLGIIDEKNKLPGKMSGGQQQRVAIARALVTNVNIILADEPTGALDQRTGEEVFEILKKINEQGKTIIIVTHDMKIAEKTNRIITIVDGKILSDSKNNNFFLSPVDNINNELSDSEKKYLKNKVRILLSIEVVIFVMLLINGAEYWSEIIAVAIMIVAGLVLIGFIKNRIRG